jgi:hypothetical protein
LAVNNLAEEVVDRKDWLQDDGEYREMSGADDLLCLGSWLNSERRMFLGISMN